MKNNFKESIKLILICLIVFFGAGFAIMTFNEDVAVKELFEKLNGLMGQSEIGIKTIQLTYGIGIATGITVFYNHFGRKQKGNEPTPIELKMKQYKDDIENYILTENKNK